MGVVRGSVTSRLTSLFLAWAPGRIERPISEVEKLREEKERVGLGLGGISDLQVDGQEGSWAWDSGNWSELEITCGRREHTVPLEALRLDEVAEEQQPWLSGTSCGRRSDWGRRDIKEWAVLEARQSQATEGPRVSHVLMAPLKGRHSCSCVQGPRVDLV